MNHKVIFFKLTRLCEAMLYGLSISIAFLLFAFPVSLVFFYTVTSIAETSQVEMVVNFMPPWVLTVLYGIITSFFQCVFGVLIAGACYFLCQRSVYFSTFIISLIMLPYALPTSVSALAFDFALKEQGYVTLFLSMDRTLLSSEMGRFIVLVLISVWQYLPFFVVITLVSFYYIPQKMVLQAKLDGATNLQIFKTILIPLSIETIGVALLLRLVLMLGKVDFAYLYFKTSILSGTETLAVVITKQFYATTEPSYYKLVVELALIISIPLIFGTLLMRKYHAL